MIKKKILSYALIAVALVGTCGTGVASAASGHSTPGGGDWTWSTIPGVHASSSYYHSTKQHSASARVGTGKVKCTVTTAGNTARATANGVGTCYVNWNTY